MEKLWAMFGRQEDFGKGLRYKIGNGFHVRCGIDPWIPGHDEFKPICYSREPSTPVSSYILDTMEWNVPRLHEDFAQIDIDRILTIPLSFYQSNDRLIWHHNTNGIYSVKLGFHLASSISEKDQESSSDDYKTWWKYFWALQIPPKVKIFAWKVVQNALPVATGLHKRKVIDSALCSRCKHAWESIGHALFSCKSAKAVWKNTKFLIDYHYAQGMFNGDYLIHLASTMEKVDVETLICVMWGIWNDRNKVLHGGTQRDPISIASFALNYIEKYRSAKGFSCKKLQQPVTHQSATQQAEPAHQLSHQHLVQNQHCTAVNSTEMPTPTTLYNPTRSNCQQVGDNHGVAQLSTDSHQQPAAVTRHQSITLNADDSILLPRPLDNITWTPPVMNMLKMNVDAAANFKNQTLRIGAVIRNYKGDVIAALSKRVQGCFRSDEMEAKALFHSLNRVSQCPFAIDFVEIDALRVSSALNSSHNDLSCFNDLIDDVRCLLSSFSRVTITHARRQANKAAHGLAKYALELDEDVS
uniref:Reverse transcriptase zinc-binding domain-containing protein n=1 Tax=Cannabis sativa TaxID=3483 RepID=A0A803NT11_CANSA